MAETAYVISVYNGGYKKIKEIAKKVLTSGGRSGILSKLFGTTGCEPQKLRKKEEKSG
ncbi:hypothetical protein [Dysosmobacter sp. Phy]